MILTGINSMKTNGIIIILASAALFSCDLFSNKSGVPINENIWVNGYLVSWEHNPETELVNSGTIRVTDIDWDALTHLTYFSLAIAEDGTPLYSLDPLFRNNFNSDRLNSIVPAAHANNTKIIFSVGGGGNYEGFSGAIEEENRAQFIDTIKMIIDEYGFDGVGLNMTPIEPEDFDNYREFVRELSSALNSIKTWQDERPLLTVAALKSEGMSFLYADLQRHFDQINILTFDMAQPWRGWLAWHNSALYSSSQMFEESLTQRLPSVDEKINEWVGVGIERLKLGIALNFYGSVWEGLNLLEQWESWPTQDMSLFTIESYNTLRESYNLEQYEWDESAKASYLNLEDPQTFVSFDNRQSIEVKMDYLKRNRLGGMMIWDLSGGFSEDNVPKNPLLKVVKDNFEKENYE